MNSIDIHLADMAPWRALLAKAQFRAKVEFHACIEEYLIQVLCRVQQSGLGASQSQSLAAAPGEYADSHQEIEKLKLLGDWCLVFVSLHPQCIKEQNIPIAQFMKIGTQAYRDYAELTGDPLFDVLADLFKDIVTVLHTLCDEDHRTSAINPLDAYELWAGTGSHHARQQLSRFTQGWPVGDASTAYH